MKNNSQFTIYNSQKKPISKNCKLPLGIQIVNCKLRLGQAMLVGIMVIFAASISLAVAGAIMASSQISAVTNQKLSNKAFEMANGCLDNVIMQMDRGEFGVPPPIQERNALNEVVGSCTISITSMITPGTTTYQITSTAAFPLVLNLDVTKKVQAVVSVSDGITNTVTRHEISTN